MLALSAVLGTILVGGRVAECAVAAPPKIRPSFLMPMSAIRWDRRPRGGGLTDGKSHLSIIVLPPSATMSRGIDLDDGR